MTKKSFYKLYWYTQAGGGFGEDDFLTTNVEHLKLYITDFLLHDPYLVFHYGVFMNLQKAEEGEIFEIDVLASTVLQIEGLEARFYYQEAYEETDPLFDIYDPSAGIFRASLTEDEQKWFEKVTDSDAEPPKVTVTIDWEKINIVPLKGKLLTEAEQLDKEEAERVGIDLPIFFGSTISGLSEEEIVREIKVRVRTDE